MLIIILTTHTGFLDQYNLHDIRAYTNKIQTLKKEGWKYRDVNRTGDSTITILYKYSIAGEIDETIEN